MSKTRQTNQTVPLLKTVKDDKTFYPGFKEGKGPTVIWINIYLQSLSAVSIENMDYEADFFLRQRWNDPRLSFQSCFNKTERLTLGPTMIEKIWLPDLFFPNEKRASFHDVTLRNTLIRIYSDGDIEYSTRITATLSCNMNLVKFPLDVQHCTLKMESYGYTEDEVLFQWSEVEQPVQISNNVELPQFHMDISKDIKISKCSSSYITGNFTCLQIEFTLSREYGYYIIQTYIPSILIVVLSWISFWITIDAVPARISLGVLTVLNVTTQSAGLWMTLPRVSYIKSIDLWMSTCVLFVFAAMLEFALVNTLVRKEVRRMTLKLKSNESQSGKHSSDPVTHALKDITYGTSSSSTVLQNRKLARRVDKAARIMFPTTFLLFNICYWTVYLFVL